MKDEDEKTQKIDDQNQIRSMDFLLDFFCIEYTCSCILLLGLGIIIYDQKIFFLKMIYRTGLTHYITVYIYHLLTNLLK